jgi:hypothetical protein
MLMQWREISTGLDLEERGAALRQQYDLSSNQPLTQVLD